MAVGKGEVGRGGKGWETSAWTAGCWQWRGHSVTNCPSQKLVVIKQTAGLPCAIYGVEMRRRAGPDCLKMCLSDPSKGEITQYLTHRSMLYLHYSRKRDDISLLDTWKKQSKRICSCGASFSDVSYEIVVKKKLNIGFVKNM